MDIILYLLQLIQDLSQPKRGNCALFLPSRKDGFGQCPKVFLINIGSFQGSI